ncbi:MAG: Cof-type HAD-IIB family hydrolase [Calditrichia bacterium]
MIRLVATDFDGTLYSPENPIGEADRRTLEWLGNKGICRVLVTGRNLYSAWKRLEPDFPIDYLIFSNGAGLLDWRSKKLLRRSLLSADETYDITELLLIQDMDFMLHMPIPLNHYFFYHTSYRQPQGDLKRRIDIYKPFTAPLDYLPDWGMPSTQFLVVYHPGEENYYNLHEIRENFTVIRTTSVLDGITTWMEIFPAGVNKATALQLLGERLGQQCENILVLGNDYNDLPMLEWSPNAWVVGNAPADLKSRFSATVACGQAPLWQVCRKYFPELESVYQG